MSARSPFRSHLLQQWTNSRRSPIAMQQWLRQETIQEEEEAGTSSPHRVQHSPSRRSFHTSPRTHDSLNLSSVDTASSIAFMGHQTSLAASLNSKAKQNPSRGHSAASSSSVGYTERPRVGQTLFDVELPGGMILHPNSATKAPHATNNSIVDIGGESSTNASTRFHVTNARNETSNNPREVQLARAIDRAVKISKSTHHRSTSEGKQPLTFRRLFSWSRSGQKLMDICYETTLKATGETTLAHQERKSWSQVPAYLVAIVPNNQASATNIDADDGNQYKALRYSPPATEEQLQDYAGACAAAQTAIHSLQGDGYNTEWVTSPVTKTPAFRTLVKAKPTDRIAALIKVDDRPRNESSGSDRKQ